MSTALFFAGSSVSIQKSDSRTSLGADDALFGRLGFVRETHNAATFSAEIDDSESSASSLEAFATELGLTEDIRAAREEIGRRITALEGGPTLRTLRLQKGMSQRELASILGTSQPRIAAIEAGRQRMGLAFGSRLAKALGVAVEVVVQAEETDSGA